MESRHTENICGDCPDDELQLILMNANVDILDDNICGMIHFSEWKSILTNIGIQENTTGGRRGIA